MQKEKNGNGNGNGDDDEVIENENQYTSDQPPPVSKTRDIFSHDSSPQEDDEQESIYEPLPRNVSSRR